MKLSQLYTESISHLSKPVQEILLEQHPHGRVEKPVPAELDIFGGNYIDWGLENLGLDAPALRQLLQALRHTGLAIPGTSHKVRETPKSTFVIEPRDGSEEAELPANWRQGAYVISSADRYLWIGSEVRQDQIGSFDRTTMRQVEGGFIAEATN